MGRTTQSSESRPPPSETSSTQEHSTASAKEDNYAQPPKSTPDEMRPSVQAFSEWLEVQHRRVGGKIADRVAGRRQGRRAILYLTVNPAFLEQERELRMQIAEGVWRYWAERATAAGLARRLGAAHVVFLNHNSEIVGGSKPSSASSIWVQGKSSSS